MSHPHNHSYGNKAFANDEEKIEALNKLQRYTQWISFQVEPGHLGKNREAMINEAREFFAGFATVDYENIDPLTGVPHLPDETVVRGIYDVAGIRAEADFLIWWHARDMESLQKALHDFRQTEFGRWCIPFWSGTGLHHPSEFNKAHLPSFITGVEARKWISVYPFVRSYEWYLMDEHDRMRILEEHGLMGRKFPQVKPNTVHSFTLGDYEWMLAFECDELAPICELMRAMRYTEARLYVREELPFHTGKQTEIGELIEGLPA